MAARVIEVIEMEAPRGRGVPTDPHRIVRQYWSKDGVLLAETDPCSSTIESQPPPGRLSYAEIGNPRGRNTVPVQIPIT